MSLYARLQDNIVFELLETEQDITTLFSPDFLWIDVTDKNTFIGQVAEQVGDSWVLQPKLNLEPDVNTLRLEVENLKNVLLRNATEATSGMADAYIAGLLSEDESAYFTEFAKYKLDLSKVEGQSGYPVTVTWPEYPTITKPY